MWLVEPDHSRPQLTQERLPAFLGNDLFSFPAKVYYKIIKIISSCRKELCDHYDVTPDSTRRQIAAARNL